MFRRYSVFFLALFTVILLFVQGARGGNVLILEIHSDIDRRSNVPGIGSTGIFTATVAKDAEACELLPIATVCLLPGHSTRTSLMTSVA